MTPAATAPVVVKLNDEVVVNPMSGIELVDDKLNVITIEVTAEDGTTKQTYKVTSYADPVVFGLIAEDAEADHRCSSDDVEDVTLTPTFSSSRETYTATVTVEAVTLTAEANDDDDAVVLEVKVDGLIVNEAEGVVLLNTDALSRYVVEVKVTAADTTTTTTYTIDLTRAPGS